MNEAVILKIIIGAFVTTVAGLNSKILWDYFSKPKENKSSIEKLTCDITAILPDIIKLSKSVEDLAIKTERLSFVVMGNGKIEESIVFKIAQIEVFMKNLQNIKESRGL
ncbi:MAG TPA: hypothetical protein VMV77_09340 [Bacteroidales bacterium]|nr:hypothetical protein [Bacteroidales bacterium]